MRKDEDEPMPIRRVVRIHRRALLMPRRGVERIVFIEKAITLPRVGFLDGDQAGEQPAQPGSGSET